MGGIAISSASKCVNDEWTAVYMYVIVKLCIPPPVPPFPIGNSFALLLTKFVMHKLLNANPCGEASHAKIKCFLPS